MRTGFSRSLLSLESDGFGGTLIALAAGVFLLALWIGWFFLARVALYEVGEARLEVDQEPHAVMSLVSGRVTRSFMELDALMEMGDLLIELDAADVQFQLDEIQAERAGRIAEQQAMEGAIEALDRRVSNTPVTVRAGLLEAGARLRDAELAHNFAEEEAANAKSVFEQGLISRQDMERIESEARRAASLEEAARRLVEKLESEGSLDLDEAMAARSAQEREHEELSTTITRLGAVEDRLERELSLHSIRAPVSGRIGDLVGVRVGEVVEARQHLGSIVPPGEMRIVAEFAPHRALGRIRPNQKARLRLQGFSWVQYGSVPATVTKVGSEPQGGAIRVELTIDDADAFPVPLSHGLPGTLQVEVERISPAALVLRAAGNRVSGPAAFESR